MGDNRGIKAIETTYKGYRFRSRLEARWAVFFDTVGVRWHYELQGYKYGEVCYLPDFYLPDLERHLEVKPDLPELSLNVGATAVNSWTWGRDSEAGFDKFLHAALCMQSGDGTHESPVKTGGLVMLCGTPGLPSLRYERGRWRLLDGAVVIHPKFFPDGREVMLELWAFAMCGGSKSFDIWPLYTVGNDASNFAPVEGCARVIGFSLPSGTVQRFYVGSGVSYDTPDLRAAATSARSARFEHGENKGGV